MLKESTMNMLSEDMRRYAKRVLENREEFKAIGYRYLSVEYSWLDHNEPKFM